MLLEIMIRQGRYSPNKLVSPKAELVEWKLEHRDAQGNLTASVECGGAVEVRFAKPAASQTFNITVRGALNEDDEGQEWTILIPTERMGILHLPPGFSTEQSIMGAVYRLPQPRNLRILGDQMLKMPGLNFTVQILS